MYSYRRTIARRHIHSVVIRSRVEVQTETISDPVIVRADGRLAAPHPEHQAAALRAEGVVIQDGVVRRPKPLKPGERD